MIRQVITKLRTDQLLICCLLRNRTTNKKLNFLLVAGSRQLQASL
jgi:hypothetical protein